jgi:A/G-specific adenine glycosylase
MSDAASVLTAFDDERAARLQADLLTWWDRGHRDLPWRQSNDPYAVLVSEVMLQQTQVSRVVPKYLAFLARFPTLDALAEASTADVIRAWSGLGYNRRAVNLQRAARAVLQEHGGRLPPTAAALRGLPGIGEYTARAVASIAFGEPVAAVDTNVRRVLTRVVDGPESARTAGDVQRLADQILARARPGAWNEALKELGALVCLPAPACGRCPLRRECVAAPLIQAVREARAPYRTGNGGRPAARYEHSTRFYRGRIVEILRAAEQPEALEREEIGRRLRLDFSVADLPWLDLLLSGLARDGLAVLVDGRAALPDG